METQERIQLSNNYVQKMTNKKNITAGCAKTQQDTPHLNIMNLWNKKEKHNNKQKRIM